MGLRFWIGYAGFAIAVLAQHMPHDISAGLIGPSVMGMIGGIILGLALYDPD